MKKGQMAFFILFGILLLVVIGGLFTFTKKTVEPHKLDSKNIDVYLKSCGVMSTEAAIKNVAFYGGYSPPPILSTISGAPIYKEKDTLVIPSRHGVESALSNEIRGNMLSCIYGMDEFPDYQITSIDAGTSVSLADDNANINIRPKGSISKGDVSKAMSEFELDAATDLGLIYETSVETAKSIEGNTICITCLRRAMSEGSGLTIKEYPDYLTFTIQTEELTYRFASTKEELDCNDIGANTDISFIRKCLEKDMKIADIPDDVNISVPAGEMKIIQVLGDTTGLQFSSGSLNITKTGYLTIKTTDTISQRIVVTDSDNLKHTMIVNVIPK